MSEEAFVDSVNKAYDLLEREAEEASFPTIVPDITLIRQ